MKHVRKFLALTLVLILALGIVGCAAPAAPDTSDAQAPAEQTTDESKPIKLTLWSCNSMIRPNELKEGQETWYISQAIERFRELHPNVTIEINAYNDNAQLMNDFKAATRAGYGPDIACFVNGPALISLKDGLLPLNDYLDDDLRTKVVGWETCAEGMNADNTIYGMPYLGQSVACFAYNKSLVKQAGLDFEANPPRTIDEFYAALDAIRDAGIQPLHLDESYPGLLLYCLSMWWEQLSGLDGILAHTDEQVSFADDEGFKFMMNEYKKFYDNGWLNKDTATSTDNYNVFLQGGSALHTLYFGDYETYHEALGDDFGMLPVPTADESLIDTDTAVGGVGAALGVSNFSENPDMAVEFVKFLLSRDEMVSMYTKNTAIPIRTDITAADIGRTDDPYFAQAVEMAGGLYFWPDNCLSADVVNIYCSLPCQVLVGNMSLDELTRAMDDAQLD